MVISLYGNENYRLILDKIIHKKRKSGKSPMKFPPNYNAQSIGRGALWSFINQSFGQILVLAVFLVTARFVSKEDFGIMATAMLGVEIFRQLLAECVGKVLLSRRDVSDGEYSAGFHLLLLSGFLAAVLVFSLSEPVAGLFGHAEISIALKWLSVLVFASGLSKIHEVWLSKHLKFKSLALRSVLSISVGGGVGIYMAIQGFGIYSLIAQQLITAIISLVWLWSAADWRPALRIKVADLAGIARQGKYLSLSAIAGFFSTQGDVVMASYYLGPAATGVYNAAKRIITAVMQIITGGINNIALPVLSSFSHEPEQFKKAYLTGVSLSVALCAPLYFGLAGLSADFVHVLLGERWVDVAPILSVLAFVGFIRNASQYSSNILLIKEKAHLQTILSYADAALNIVLLIIFAPQGLLPLSIAIAIKTLVISPITTRIALKLLGIGAVDYLKTILPVILYSGVMAGAVWFLRDAMDLPAIVNLLILIPAGATIYAGLMFVFSRQSAIELLNHALAGFRKS